MKKKSALVFLTALVLFLTFTFFPVKAEALSRRGNDEATKTKTARARMRQIGQSDDDSTANVKSEVRARKRFSNLIRTTTASTTCARMGYAGSKDDLDRGVRNCPNGKQDPEFCVPAPDGSGNQNRYQENNRFDGSGNPNAGQKNRANDGSGNQNGKQENRRFDGSGNPDAGQADRSCDGSKCLNPDCTATPKRDGTGNRNRGNSTN